MKCTNTLVMVAAFAILGTIALVRPSEANSDGSEDPSCEAVNLAYAAMMNADRSTEMVFAEQQDGSLAFVTEIRSKSGVSYQKDANSEQWMRYRRPKWVPVDTLGPKITDCQFLGDTSELGFAAKHYSGIRDEMPLRSKVEFWITERDGRIAKARTGPWAVKLKSGAGEISILKFDDEAVPPPF